MSQSRIVLVTGSAGRIGQAAVRALKEHGWHVRGFDLVPTPKADESIVGDIVEGKAIRQAAHGAEAIIHLAAIPDDDDFLTKLLPANGTGVYHVLEAARLGGVRRLVLGSSGQVVWWQRYTGPLPIGTEVQPTPRAWYACLKVFLEAAGRAYAEAQNMTVLAARLGWCPRTAEHAAELAATEWGPDVYLSPRDAGRFFACTVAPLTDVRYAVVYACSRHVRQAMYDMRPAKELLGYEPQDTWPEGLD